MRITLAGRVGIERDGAAVDTAGLGKLGRLAFAYLVSERHRPVARDELAEVLWDEDLPRTWDTSLRVVLSKVRTWLASAGLDRSATITSSFGTYQLHLPEGATVDFEQAAADVDAARAALAAGNPDEALARAAAAGAIAAADFLPEAGGRWVEQRQAELRELRLQAFELAAEASLARLDAPAALGAAEAAVALEPLRESAHLLVMQAYAASGNRGAALRAYERLRRLLAEELGLSPSAVTEAVYLQLLGGEERRPSAGAQAAAAVAADRRPSASLPLPVSSFVGRTGQVDEVAALVRSSRIVTLTGTGGLGKTRLALEVARVLGGAVFVPLADIGDRAGLRGPTAVAAVHALAIAALGLAEEPGVAALDTLAHGLRDAQVLLVLDNCEHVVEAAAELVDTVVRACPGVVVLATSREALQVPGEVVWSVPPLDPPDARRLFAERAAAVAPGFILDAADEEAVDTLCRRLDRLPLALELAAARTDLFNVREIVDRLDDLFRLLRGGARTAPARHQTLRAAIDWTYEALEDVDRRLLHHLSLFAGSWTLDAAVAVAGGAATTSDDVADRLRRLVGRSLVAVELTPGRGPTRYRLLETVQAYAAEKLEASGEGTAARARLVDWAMTVAEQAENDLDGPGQADALDRLDADAATFRAALTATRGVEEGAVRLATALAPYWEIRGHFTEGREWLRIALDAAGEDVPPLVRARAQNAAAILAQRQGDYAAARSRLEASLALRRQAGDTMGTAIALHGLGNVAALQHEPEAARRLYEESLAAGRELGNDLLVASALDNLGWVAHATSDFPAARAYYAEALSLRRRLGDQRGLALALAHLGDLAYQQGDYGTAQTSHGESLELRTRLGDRAGRADSLATLGHLAMHDGDLAGARQSLIESLAIRRDLGDRAGLPAVLVSLSDVHLSAGELGSASTLLEEAAAVGADLRDGPTLAHVHVHLARVARLEGRVEAALSHYLDAHRAAGGLAADAVTAEWLEGVGAALAAAGDGHRGARFLGAADALRTSLGTPVPPHERPASDRDRAALESALGPAQFASAWRAGHALSLDAAVQEAVAAMQSRN